MRSLALVFLLAACGGNGPDAAAPVPRPEKSVQLNKPGEMVQIELVEGYVTVVDFWGDHCGACKVVGGMLAVQTAKDPAILIRKVDVGDGFTPVAEAYEISALPHYRIFDKHKHMRYVLVGNDTLKAPDLAKQLAAEP
ncbi:MAG TPA: thioredoxin domain-containing protein [Kofleriaceae bacterium]|jgi:thiol-disulfide isomerase/thioredoxin